MPAKGTLRTFLSNYQNVVRGKRSGHVYESVNHILVRCSPTFVKILHHREDKTKEETKKEGGNRGEGTGTTRLTLEEMETRVTAWCTCYTLFGKWPSLACYKSNKTAWQKNAVLNTTHFAQLVNTFKNYRQSVRKNGSGTLKRAVLHERMEKLDPLVFKRSYKKEKIDRCVWAMPPNFRRVTELPNLITLGRIL